MTPTVSWSFAREIEHPAIRDTLDVSNAEFAGLLSAVNRLQMSGFTVGCEESTVVSSVGLNLSVPALPVL